MVAPDPVCQVALHPTGKKSNQTKKKKCIYVYYLADSGFFNNFLYQGGVKSAVSWVFEDLKFKISEGSDPNWL